MSIEQNRYNEAIVTCDGKVFILIDKFTDHTDDACHYTITVKQANGKIAQELHVKADEIKLVRL